MKNGILGAALTLAAAAGGSLALAPATPAFGQAQTCDRACLQGHVENYLAAVLAHDSSRLALADGYKATYNGRPTLFSEPYWATTEEFPFRQFVFEPATGSVALFAVARESNMRGTFYLRLKVRNGRLTEIETIVGDRRVDGVPGLISPNPLFDYVLPPAQRRTREELVAIASTYPQGLADHDGSRIPVTPDCRRFEDGVQSSLNPLNGTPRVCNEGFEAIRYMDSLDNRRVVLVDVERGLVVSNSVIRVSTPPQREPRPRTVDPVSGMIMPPNPWSSRPHDTLGQAVFKIIDGRIVEIQVIRRDMPYGWGSGW